MKTYPIIEMVSSSWKRFLATDAKNHEIVILQKHERTGFLLGKDEFVKALKVLLVGKLKRRKPGPKKKDE